MSNSIILFFSANPQGSDHFYLQDESRQIEQKIRGTAHRDVLEFIPKYAVRPDDLIQFLLQFEPHVVHFSGRGSLADEIILSDAEGKPKPVSKAAISQLFKALKGNIRVVVLSSCFSRPQAEAITEVIDCVVGMNRNLDEAGAIVFTASFYRAIGFGRSVWDAFEQGKSALLLEGIQVDGPAELIVRKDVDPNKIFIVGQSIDPPHPPPPPPPPLREVVWPPPCRPTRIVADREPESELFMRMITGQSQQRVLLIQGLSGHGKTFLLQEFYEHASKLLGLDACARVDLKGCPPIEDVFRTIQLYLGSRLPTFEDCKHPKEKDGTKILRDLQKSRTPILFLFDTFQEVSDQTRKWILSLLDCAVLSPGLVVVICGQTLPERKNTIWYSLAVDRTLGAIPDVRHWRDFVIRKWNPKDLTIPENELRMLMDLTDLTHGEPFLMNALIERLAERLASKQFATP